MSLQTNVTFFKSAEEVTAPAENGAYVHGLVLEGAAWELGAPGQEGYLIEQRPKELHPKLPVVNVISALLKDKRTVGQYDCPVYYTTLQLHAEGPLDPNKSGIFGSAVESCGKSN